MLKSISRQQSLSFIDYIYLNKILKQKLCWTYVSKTETKKDNPGELCSSYRFFFSLKQREITQVNQQPTKG